MADDAAAAGNVPVSGPPSKRRRANQKAGHDGYRHHFQAGKGRGRKKQLQLARENKARKTHDERAQSAVPSSVPSSSSAAQSVTAVPVENAKDADLLSTVGLLKSSLLRVRQEYQALQKDYFSVSNRCSELKEDTCVLKLQLHVNHIEAARTIMALQHQLKSEIEKQSSVKDELQNEKIENCHIRLLFENYKKEQEIQTRVFTARIKQLETEKNNLSDKVKEMQQQQLDEHGKKTVVDSNVDLLEVTKRDSGKYNVRDYGKKGKTFQLVHLPTALKRSSEVEIRNIEKRVNKLYELLRLLSKPGSEDDLVCTLSQFMSQFPEVTARAAEKAGLPTSYTLTPAASVDLKILLNLPWTRLRNFKIFLQNHGIPLIAPEHLMRKDWESRLENLKCDVDIEIGLVKLKVKQSSNEEKDVAFVRVKNLKKMVENVYEKHLKKDNLIDRSEFEGCVYLKAGHGADKGGSSTKLCLELVNIDKCNSAENTELISFFEGTDSLENMWKVFGMYKDQFKSLNEIQVGDRMLEVKRFLFGDYHFLCSCTGHQGASASFPCLWCLVPLKVLRKNDGNPPNVAHTPYVRLGPGDTGDWTENGNCRYTQRTVEMMESDYSSNKEDPRNNGDVNKNGSNHNSIIAEMLFPVEDMLSIVPLPLHIFLGLGHDAFKRIEADCREKDRATMGTYNPDLYDRWESLTLEVTEKKDLLNDLEKSIKNGNAMVKALKVSKNKPAKRNEEKCSSIICIAYSPLGRESADILDWVQCDDCDEWFHNICVGMSSEQTHNLDEFRCSSCLGEVTSADEVVNKQAAQVLDLTLNLTTAKEELAPLQAELNVVYGQVKSQRGPLEMALHEKLAEIGVDLQAYHSNAMVGNHVHKLLSVNETRDNPSILLEVLLDFPELRQRHVQYLHHLGSIHSHLFESRFLSESEINTLCSLCWSLGQWYPQNFPSETVSPKMHILIFHVPQFVRRWKSIGLFSESGLESIHARMNQINRVYATIRNKTMQAKLVFQNQSVTSTANRNLLKPKKTRKCQVCGCWLKRGACLKCMEITE